MAQTVRDAVREYEALGATVKEISLPNTHLAIAAYYVIAPAEASANLSRFDGVRYGYRCDNPKDLMDLYTRTRAEGFGSEVKRRILVGSYALSAPSPAFALGSNTDDPVKMYLEDIFTIAINLAGVPAMSIPAGQIKGLPVGLQLIGNYFDEARLLNAAHQFQQATDWHQQSPAG